MTADDSVTRALAVADAGYARAAGRPFRHLCPEADLRDAMTDAEFWEHVARNLGYDDEPFDDGSDFDVTLDREPCPECGESGACAYDSEGRALIHAVTDEDGDP